MTDYYVSTTTGALLRRRDSDGDRAFYGGEWHRTNTIMEYMVGDESNVEPVTEGEARTSHPDAF